MWLGARLVEICALLQRFVPVAVQLGAHRFADLGNVGRLRHRLPGTSSGQHTKDGRDQRHGDADEFAHDRDARGSDGDEA